MAVIWVLESGTSLPPSAPALLTSRVQLVLTELGDAMRSATMPPEVLERSAIALENAVPLALDPRERSRVLAGAQSLRQAEGQPEDVRRRRAEHVRTVLGQLVGRWRLRLETRPAEPPGRRRP
ncbi:MAG: hypothetical protein VKO21_03100 [Candidatus Sericytochromatia bacterium]|nr:hypothetical protein [Candidatus Sericytochromatia bacterium]